jgi:diguanylate cyclase (GGDEF)-like protein/PAS domain S-box-containing protein
MLRTLLVSYLALGALFCFGLTIWLWQRRSLGALLVSGLMLCTAIYALSYGLELSSNRLEAMLWCIRLEYLGIVNLPALWLALALYYLNQPDWLRPPRLLLLWIIPLLVLLAVFTNSFHRLHYASASVDLAGPFPTLRITRGPLYLLQIGYNFFAFLVVLLLLGRQFFSAHPLYRQQAALFLLVSLLTIAVFTLHLLGATPLSNLDINPFMMVISAGLLGWGVTKMRLIDFTPLARETLFEQLSDPVLVLDDQALLMDFNPAAARLFGLSADSVGQPLARALPSALRASFENLAPQAAEQELRLDEPAAQRFFDCRVTPLDRRGGLTSGVMVMLHDITQRKQAQSAIQQQMEAIRALQDRLREQAIRDPLTTCYNRRYLAETLPRELARARRENYPLSLVMIDIDHFKTVNDTHGHPTGDAVLRALGRLLHSRCRAGDMVCRYGGEEFLLVLPNLLLDSALLRAETWRAETATLRLRQDQQAIGVTVSIGVAAFPQHGEEIGALIQAVDQALYAAKRAGRNCVQPPPQALPPDDQPPLGEEQP